jgi:type II secretion system protein H
MKVRANPSGCFSSCLSAAFTLIEIMMVVAVMGLAMAVGMPSFMSSIKKEGMRKALDDLQKVCYTAREQAILKGVTTAITFYPTDRKYELDGTAGSNGLNAATLPDGVDFAMLDINLQDFGASPWAKVFFYPNGTCNEMTIVLHSRDEWKKVTLEFSTSLAVVSDVDK